MRNEYLNKVEDNAYVCTWSEKTQLEKGDSVTEGYTPELWDFTRVNLTDLPYLLDVKVDRHLFRAMVQFWNLSYSFFTFGDVDLVPTLEEYTTLFCCPRIQSHKVYVRPASLPAFTKKLVMITGMSEQWANTPVPAILAETIRSLNGCRRAGEGRFIGCAQLLLETVDRPRRDDISEERWLDILQNLREEDVIWKAPWLYRARQFIPATQGLAQSDLSYKGDHYKKRMREIFEAWKKPFCMKILTKGSTSTLKYKGWFSRRINDNVPRPTLGVARSLEKRLRVIPSDREGEKEKEEDRDDLKTHYKKAQVTLKRVRLGRSSEQWQHKIQDERAKAEYWQKRI
ncbi:hypothetical protein CXB51_022112 [Gossypium anomalum]|uniref:DUF7745 domain-containing protein n=1 Tax=Gossypium anomalum TaxID=47600 RepID=A0A8J6CTV4_9ROSI|nr:hypothetical protein CXB51_022112 [Gossypium anomalum]